MKKRVLANGLAAAFVGTLFVSGTANAMFVDFTSNTFLPIDSAGTTTFTTNISGLDINLNGNGNQLTFNSGADAPGAFSSQGVSFAGVGDGIGLTDDEIGGNEKLTVSFSPNVALNSIYLLDLFFNGSEIEAAKFDITSDGNVVDTEGILGTSSSTIGFVTWGGTLGLDSVLSIDFTALSCFPDTDYSLAGLDVDVAPVPEPATMLLFGSGLIGLAGLARKKRK